VLVHAVAAVMELRMEQLDLQLELKQEVKVRLLKESCREFLQDWASLRILIGSIEQ